MATSTYAVSAVPQGLSDDSLFIIQVGIAQRIKYFLWVKMIRYGWA